MENKSLAMSLIEEIKLQSKRKDIIIILLISALIGTIVCFLLYMNQFDYSNENTATLETENNGTITTGDIDNG